jgi:asparagine synthase (glutamine-hydrolysing)
VASFTDIPRMLKLSRRLSGDRMGRIARRVLSPIVSRLSSQKYAGLFEYGGSAGGAYLLRRALYIPWKLDTVLDDKANLTGRKAFHRRSQIRGPLAGLSIDQ